MSRALSRTGRLIPELGRGGPDEYSYVIMAFASGKSGLVGESALALMEQWVACPGEHRPQPFA